MALCGGAWGDVVDVDGRGEVEDALDGVCGEGFAGGGVSEGHFLLVFGVPCFFGFVLAGWCGDRFDIGGRGLTRPDQGNGK